MGDIQSSNHQKLITFQLIGWLLCVAVLLFLGSSFGSFGGYAVPIVLLPALCGVGTLVGGLVRAWQTKARPKTLISISLASLWLAFGFFNIGLAFKLSEFVADLSGPWAAFRLQYIDSGFTVSGTSSFATIVLLDLLTVFAVSWRTKKGFGFDISEHETT